MRLQLRQLFRIILIFIITTVSFQVFGQERYVFFTPRIDSICQNTLDYIRIRQSLILQQYQVNQDIEQIGRTIDMLNQNKNEYLSDLETIKNELDAVNRHIDSLTPKRPDGPRPKENIIDILNERFSFHGNYGLNINQLALSNWAAGGENAWTGKAFANFALIYHKKRFEQKLVGAFAFGISRFGDKRIEKQDDKIDLTYSLSLDSKTQWNISAVATFNTQFANGYKYPNDSTIISTFFAPAYLTVSAGYSYKTKDEHLQVFMSPLAGKVTFVMNQELADKGAFGVKKGYYNQDSIWIPGENIAPAIGINVIINYKQPIRLDVNWENTIHFTITKFLSTILFVHLKYDHNTTFPKYEEIEGVQTVVDNVPKLQFKESIGIAFLHKF